MGTSFFIILFFTAFLSPALSQPTAPNPPHSTPDLVQLLTPTFGADGTPNAAGATLFPLPVVLLETPLAIRYVFLLAIANYQVSAACHPIALSFFGIKDNIPPPLCEPLPKTLITAYARYRVLLRDFPVEATVWAQFLVQAGLNPFNDTTDLSTPLGWGNVIGSDVANYAAKDGWNSQGDDTRANNRRQFEDSTDYIPVNHADLKPFRLIKPLRWQPLTQPIDFRGRFASQKHVTPHVGLTSIPLTISKDDFAARRVPGPYENPDMLQRLSASDRKKVMGYIDELFSISANLTQTQIAQAFYWNNKFISLGVVLGTYSAIFELDSFTVDRLALGEMMAQYDAVLVAWKEKRRHDLVRPSTLIRRLRKGRKAFVFRNVFEGLGEIDASEWEPLVATQPHSEFPSASATICTASVEHLEVGLRDILGPDVTIPPFQGIFNPTFFALPGESVSFTLNTMKEIAQNCGQSRLFAGVHFPPSVPAGEELGTGIGRAAYEHVAELAAGRVPEVCARCRSQ